MVYLIVGHTGYYDDRCEWCVGYLADEKRARIRCNKLNNELKRHGMHIDTPNVGGNYPAEEITLMKMKRLDAGFQFDYTGTYYDVVGIQEIIDE